MQIKDLTTPFNYVTTDRMAWCSTGGIDSYVSYGDFRTAISNYCITQNPGTNNARLFDCSYRLNGDYAAGDMIAGATTLNGTQGNALFAGQIVLRYFDTNKQNNGLWQIQTSGAAVRYSKANTGGLLMFSVAMPNAGTYKGKWYKCTNYAPNIGTDAIEYAEIFTPRQSLETTDSPTFAGAIIDGVSVSSEDENIKILYGLYKGLIIDEWKYLSDKQNKVENVSDTEIGYLNGVTGNIQSQLGDLYNAIPTKANISSPAFTGYVEIPNLRISPEPYGTYNPNYDILFESYRSSPIENGSGTYVKGKLYGKLGFVFDNIAGVTKLGTVVANSIEISADEISCLNGVTGNIQTQLDNKQDVGYASIYVTDGTATQSIPTGTTYTKVTAYTNNGVSANCIADVANDKITITVAGVYKVNYTASYTSGTNNVTFRGAVFVGGVEQGNIHSGGQMGLAGAMRSTSCCGFINVTSVPTDIDVRIRHDNGGSVDITHVYANLNVEKIG